MKDFLESFLVGVIEVGAIVLLILAEVVAFFITAVQGAL